MRLTIEPTAEVISIEGEPDPVRDYGTAHIRPDCLPVPPAMAGRPVERRGYPVPWFATWTAEGWDLRVVRPERAAEAVRRTVCWVSGQPLGRYRAFVIGPMCTINRVSADPPTTRDIALWSARVCPFLSRPLAVRNSRGLAEMGIDPEAQRGGMLTRNPGVVAVWVTDRYRVGTRGTDRGLFFLGDPAAEVAWFTEGRPASRAEVEAAITTGLPALRAAAEPDGPLALAELDRLTEAARAWLPV